MTRRVLRATPWKRIDRSLRTPGRPEDRSSTTATGASTAIINFDAPPPQRQEKPPYLLHEGRSLADGAQAVDR